jgi:hypothetical protein
VVPTSLGGRLLNLYRHHFGAFVHAAFAIVHSHPTGISIVCFIGCSKWSPINSQPPGRQPATPLVEVIRLIVAVRLGYWVKTLLRASLESGRA